MRHTAGPQAAVFDLVSDAVVSRTSAAGPVTYLNQAAERLYGWTREEIALVADCDPLQTEYPAPVEEIEAQLRDHGSWEGRLVRRTRDGRRLVVDSRWVWPGGRGPGSSVTQVDHEVSTIESLGPGVQQDAVFRLLVSSVRDYAIYLLDPEGRVVTWNEGAQRLKQYRPEEILGRDFSVLYVPEERSAGRPAQNLARAAAEGQFAEEGWRVRKDGTRFWASVLLTPLRDDSGQLRGFVKITRDLTAQHLEIERLAELEAVKSQFLRLASHELGGPLAIIRGYTSMLEEGMWGEPTPDQAKAYRVLDRKARHMVWLVNQLLDAARLEDGELVSELSRLDLREPVTEAFDEARSVAPSSHHLVLRVPERPVTVDGDREALVSIVHNLLNNAIKYSPRGGDVLCELSVHGTTAAVAVTDQGLGISAPDMARLFTRFGRILTRDNSGIPGAGLGLYLSRELARRQRGDLDATSAGGRGSTFRLTLPLAAAQVTP